MNHGSHVQLARLFARCTVNETGCWVWNGSRFRDGYAHIRNRPGHRVSWEIVNGPIPSGICACHHCDHKPCINPLHLFLGTHRDNMLDAAKKGILPTGDRNGRRLHPERYDDAVLRGERNGFSKLTDEQVTEMHRLNALGVPRQAIATKFDITSRYLCEILAGRRWEHIRAIVEEARRG